ncbi:MAG TPA: hypothetical protein PLR99_08480 [Polyangiaceae bacterium]|nr:hypothetical protein [Polyangiaceae bacterium]
MATEGSNEVDATLAAWLLDPPSEGAVLTALHAIARARGARVAVIAPRGHKARFTLPERPPAALVRIGEATEGQRVQCERGDPLWDALRGDGVGEERLEWLVSEPFGPASSGAVVLAAPRGGTCDMARLARGAAVVLERAPAEAAAAEAAHTRGNLIAAVVYNLDYAGALLDEASGSPHDADLRRAVRNALEAMARLSAMLLPGASCASPQAVRGGLDDGDDTGRNPEGELP